MTLNGVQNVPPSDQLVPLVEFSINQAVSLCASDYRGAIKDTITTVKKELTTNGIAY